jgi:hypothetical protein
MCKYFKEREKKESVVVSTQTDETLDKKEDEELEKAGPGKVI